MRGDKKNSEISREVPVFWEPLEDAFENNAREVHSYLNLDTGAVTRIVDGVSDPALHRRVSVSPQYIKIDPISSREQYRWMERYIETVEDALLEGSADTGNRRQGSVSALQGLTDRVSRRARAMVSVSIRTASSVHGRMVGKPPHPASGARTMGGSVGGTGGLTPERIPGSSRALDERDAGASSCPCRSSSRERPRCGGLRLLSFFCHEPSMKRNKTPWTTMLRPKPQGSSKHDTGAGVQPAFAGISASRLGAAVLGAALFAASWLPLLRPRIVRSPVGAPSKASANARRVDGIAAIVGAKGLKPRVILVSDIELRARIELAADPAADPAKARIRRRLYAASRKALIGETPDREGSRPGPSRAAIGTARSQREAEDRRSGGWGPTLAGALAIDGGRGGRDRRDGLSTSEGGGIPRSQSRGSDDGDFDIPARSLRNGRASLQAIPVRAGPRAAPKVVVPASTSSRCRTMDRDPKREDRRRDPIATCHTRCVQRPRMVSRPGRHANKTSRNLRV